jgi:Uma2 family endonuclease
MLPLFAMASTARDRHGDKTIEDWRALPAGHHFELIDGELVEKAAPTLEHGRSQGRTISTIRDPFDRRPGGPSGPGGWWTASEVDILLDGRIFRPDVLGWRRDHASTLPRDFPVTLRPDWICEILSDSNRATDTITKVRRYHQGGVPHYWLLDHADRTLTVYRYTPDGYLVAVRAEASETIRAEPFDAIELRVGALFGDDDDE